MGTLTATMESNTFRGKFNYEYGTWGNLPEPMIIANQAAYLSLTDAALRLSNPLQIEFWYYYFDTQNWTDTIGVWEIQNNGTNWLKFGIANNSVNAFVEMRVNNVLDSFNLVGFFDTVPGFYKIKIVWSATSMTVYKNDVLVTTEAVENLNNMVSAGATIRLFNTLAGDEPVPAGHSMFHWIYTLNSVLTSHIPICEDSGNIAYDVSGNSLHFTGQAGYNARTWSLENDDEYYLGVYGYRLSGLVYIPSLLDQSNAADGNALTNIPPDTDFN